MASRSPGTKTAVWWRPWRRRGVRVLLAAGLAETASGLALGQWGTAPGLLELLRTQPEASLALALAPYALLLVLAPWRLRWRYRVAALALACGLCWLLLPSLPAAGDLPLAFAWASFLLKGPLFAAVSELKPSELRQLRPGWRRPLKLGLLAGALALAPLAGWETTTASQARDGLLTALGDPPARARWALRVLRAELKAAAAERLAAEQAAVAAALAAEDRRASEQADDAEHADHGGEAEPPDAADLELPLPPPPLTELLAEGVPWGFFGRPRAGRALMLLTRSPAREQRVQAAVLRIASQDRAGIEYGLKTLVRELVAATADANRDSGPDRVAGPEPPGLRGLVADVLAGLHQPRLALLGSGCGAGYTFACEPNGPGGEAECQLLDLLADPDFGPAVDELLELSREIYTLPAERQDWAALRRLLRHHPQLRTARDEPAWQAHTAAELAPGLHLPELEVVQLWGDEVCCREHAYRALERDPGDPVVHGFLAASYLHQALTTPVCGEFVDMAGDHLTLARRAPAKWRLYHQTLLDVLAAGLSEEAGRPDQARARPPAALLWHELEGEVQSGNLQPRLPRPVWGPGWTALRERTSARLESLTDLGPQALRAAEGWRRRLTATDVASRSGSSEEATGLLWLVPDWDLGELGARAAVYVYREGLPETVLIWDPRDSRRLECPPGELVLRFYALPREQPPYSLGAQRLTLEPGLALEVELPQPARGSKQPARRPPSGL